MKLVREYINEKFSDKSDPVKDMGIGIPDDVIELAGDFPQSNFNPNYNKFRKIIKQGSFIGVKFRSNIMFNTYKQLF